MLLVVIELQGCRFIQFEEAADGHFVFWNRGIDTQSIVYAVKGHGIASNAGCERWIVNDLSAYIRITPEEIGGFKIPMIGFPRNV